MYRYGSEFVSKGDIEGSREGDSTVIVVNIVIGGVEEGFFRMGEEALGD